ncbi:hypothetical protein [Tepidibacter aestuarii]|uniref:hypothetical protein n=1 Tax=Tepidibacter aestuarii TaxID=2925782 RepID=UPI0020BF34C7|nr:hypothetical protein [Tepidibacter aestuarii]CAH2213015.1 protein of unknown function [Tepidibacter aestuarii]
MYKLYLIPYCNGSFRNLFQKINVLQQYEYNRLEYMESPNMKFTIDIPTYIRKIDKIVEKTERYDLALNKIMKDFNFYKDQLNQINKVNWNRICRKINQLVIKHGEVDKELHYLRNLLNRAPRTLEEMLKLNENLPKKIKWRLLEPEKSVFHMYGKYGEFNLKFVSHDGKFEAVYNKNGELLTEKNDQINMGTYNYADPDDIIKHFIYDVAPYLRWGNTYNSLKPQIYDVDANLARFKMNKHAKNRYERVRKQLEGK